MPLAQEMGDGEKSTRENRSEDRCARMLASQATRNFFSRSGSGAGAGVPGMDPLGDAPALDVGAMSEDQLEVRAFKLQ